jgi:2'-5' RNA ligase
MRLFFGVPLEGEALAAAQQAQARLRELAVGARLSWANAQQLHLTLAFLGEQDAAAAERAKEAGREAAASGASFPMALGAAGAFPTPERPRVIWMGAAEGQAALALLAERLRAALRARGVGFDDKPFRAHATLARVRPGDARAAARALAALGPAGQAAQEATSFALFESRAGRHEALERFALA